MHYLPSPAEARRMTTSELRSAFLVDDLWKPGEATIRFIDLDRVALGGFMPTGKPIPLPNPAELAAEYFTERRELGVVNIGGAGSIAVDGTVHAMANRDGLYIGRGSREVLFSSDDPARPARFYVVSYPAHAPFATTHVAPGEVYSAELGSQDGANRRT